MRRSGSSLANVQRVECNASSRITITETRTIHERLRCSTQSLRSNRIARFGHDYRSNTDLSTLFPHSSTPSAFQPQRGKTCRHRADVFRRSKGERRAPRKLYASLEALLPRWLELSAVTCHRNLPLARRRTPSGLQERNYVYLKVVPLNYELGLLVIWHWGLQTRRHGEYDIRRC